MTLIFIGCQNEKKYNSLIDLVPTNPLILVKYDSSISSEKFNQNFNNLINIKIDSVLKNYGKDEILISYHKIGKKSIVPIYFTSSENKNNNFEKIIDSILYDGSIIKKIGTERRIQQRKLYVDYHVIETETNYMIFTNVKDALNLDNSDDRFFIGSFLI